jgi:biopolymer transport protein ExbD
MAFSAGSSSATTSSEINVTPLIDVLLVLLIIFMVIVPVTPRGLNSQMPQSSASQDQGLGPVSVRILMNSADSMGSAGPPVVYEVEGRRMQRAQVAGALLSSFSARSNRGVFLAASPQVSYQVVAAIVGEARAAGATTVALGRL